MAETDVQLTTALRRAGVADVNDSGLARALYSSDASLHRVLPRATGCSCLPATRAAP